MKRILLGFFMFALSVSSALAYEVTYTNPSGLDLVGVDLSSVDETLRFVSSSNTQAYICANTGLGAGVYVSHINNTSQGNNKLRYEGASIYEQDTGSGLGIYQLVCDYPDVLFNNLLDPINNIEVVEITEQGGNILSLSIDWIYSMILFAIYFVQINFTDIAILTVLGFLTRYGIKKFFPTKGKNTDDFFSFSEFGYSSQSEMDKDLTNRAKSNKANQSDLPF